jgi:hypothetical protein
MKLNSNQTEARQLIIDILSRQSLEWKQQMILIHSLVTNELQAMLQNEQEVQTIMKNQK